MSRSRNVKDPGVALGAALGIALVLGVIPIILVPHFGLDLSFEVLTVSIYILQLLIVFRALKVNAAVPTARWILVAIIYALAQTLTLLTTANAYGTVHPLDLTEIAAKIIGVVVFAASFAITTASRSGLDRFLQIFLALTVVAILYNFLINAGSLNQITAVSSSYNLSFSSFFGNRNQFGHFLFVSLVAHSLYVAMHRFSSWNVVLYAAQLLSMILTFSRGALIATMIGATVLVILVFRKRPFLSFTLGALGFIAGWNLLTGRYSNLLERLFFRTDVGLAGREQLWKFGLDVWNESSPALGVGTHSGLELAKDSGMEFNEYHSFFLETLVSGGIVELVIIVALLIGSWQRISKSSLDDRVRYIFHAAFGGLCVLLTIESISFFTVGFVGAIFTVFFIALPQWIAGSHSNGNIQPIFQSRARTRSASSL